MPNTGDSFEVTIEKAHLEWGTYRYTNTRDRIYGEGYVKIPLSEARRYNILAGTDYTACSADGFINFDVKASGSAGEDYRYAKQFQGKGNLKAIGVWYENCGASVGDKVRVEFLSPSSVKFTLIQ